MAKYAALIYTAESGVPAREAYRAHRAFAEEVQQAGVLRGGDGLLPTSAATTVRVRDGRTSSTHGSVAETREQLSGFYLFGCRDLDEAIGWAARIPDAARGSIELRPVLESEGVREAWAVVERLIKATKHQRAEYEARPRR